MSLEYAMLGFLQSTPLSGYDMKKMFDNTIKHFWSADQSQIYRTLARLTEANFIKSETVINDGKPNSKVYYITDEGKEKFNQWLLTPTAPVEPRISWLIQIFFAGGLPDEAIIDLLEQITVKMREIKETYEKYFLNETQNSNGQISKRDLFFRKLTIDYGIAMNQSTIGWIENAIDSIRRKEYCGEEE